MSYLNFTLKYEMFLKKNYKYIEYFKAQAVMKIFLKNKWNIANFKSIKNKPK